MQHSKPKLSTITVIISQELAKTGQFILSHRVKYWLTNQTDSKHLWGGLLTYRHTWSNQMQYHPNPCRLLQNIKSSSFGLKCQQICRQSLPICCPSPFRQPVMHSVGGQQMWPIHLPEAQHKEALRWFHKRSRVRGFRRTEEGETLHIPPASV